MTEREENITGNSDYLVKHKQEPTLVIKPRAFTVGMQMNLASESIKAVAELNQNALRSSPKNEQESGTERGDSSFDNIIQERRSPYWNQCA